MLKCFIWVGAIGNLVGRHSLGNGIITDTKESLQQLYNAEYEPKLEAMDQEYWNKTVAAETISFPHLKIRRTI